MSSSIISTLMGAGVLIPSPGSIAFITKKLHHDSRDNDFDPDDLRGQGRLICDKDILEYYAANGDKGGLVLCPGPGYDAIKLSWLLGAKGVAFDEALNFIEHVEA